MLEMLSLPEDGGAKEQRGGKSCGTCVRACLSCKCRPMGRRCVSGPVRGVARCLLSNTL
jgi:hypothetical protein